ncbi:MAG: FAD-dependent oxidoreductase [Bacteroidota bacterium]
MATYQILGDKVIEGARETGVLRKADVVVAGGGPAGLAAAVAAARAGAKVVLIERDAFLGGVATGSMMAALVGSGWATGVGLELMDRLADMGGAPKWDSAPGRTGTTPFDPEVFKDAALEMIHEAGVDLLLHTWAAEPIVVEGKAMGVMTQSKSGRQAVLGKVVIDCTGDADLAAAAGASCLKGRESDHRMRPFALLFRLGGLDIPKIVQYVSENPEELQPQFRTGTLLKVGDEEVITRVSGFYKLVETAKMHGGLYPECHYFRLEDLWVNRGTAICNTTRIYYVDGTNVNDLTKGQIEGRKQIRKLIAFARKYIPGCENAFLIDTAPSMGVRETRRIVGEYSLTDEDAYSDARFEDAITTMHESLVRRPRPANLDIHMPDPIEGSPQDLIERFPERVPRESHSYQIPFRALLPKGIDGLLVAGRAISVSHMIDSTTRLMLICMRTGQAAGAAAALSARKGISPRRLDYAELRSILVGQGMAGIA